MTETILSRQALADLFGWGPARVDRNVAKGMPVREKNDTPGRADKYSVPDVVRWLQKQGRASNKLQDARTRETKARAALRELELKTRRGELLPKATVIQTVGAVYSVVRTTINNLPGQVSRKAAAMDDPQQIENLLNDAVSTALEALGEGLEHDVDALQAKREATPSAAIPSAPAHEGDQNWF